MAIDKVRNARETLKHLRPAVKETPLEASFVKLIRMARSAAIEATKLKKVPTDLDALYAARDAFPFREPRGVADSENATGSVNGGIGTISESENKASAPGNTEP